MNFVHVNAPGSADCLELRDMSIPEPAQDQVLIRVAAAGVNRPDIVQRQGLYPPPPDASPVLGLEVAGEVVACGSDVKVWRPGDSVCALVNGGGYAEFAVAPQAQCLPVPSSLSLIEAAALPEACFTVWHNLWQRAQIKAGETLLVHGGSSGIGTMAIQMAVALGHRVFTTAGTAEKCRACEILGAVQAINYRQQDFVEEIKQSTVGRGIDVILDMVGGDYIQKNISIAAQEGRIINIAFLAGSKAKVDFLPLMMKRLTLGGSTLRAQSASIKAKIAQELQARIWPLIEQGKIAPLISDTFPLRRVGDAHRLLESGTVIGKVVLTAHE